MDPKQFRQIIKEEVTTIIKAELKPVDKRLGKVEESLSTVKTEIKELRENVDAARGDIEHIHMDIKGIRDDIGLKHQRDKREIDEIKTHLDMPLIPDVPEV